MSSSPLSEILKDVRFDFHPLRPVFISVGGGRHLCGDLGTTFISLAIAYNFSFSELKTLR